MDLNDGADADSQPEHDPNQSDVTQLAPDALTPTDAVAEASRGHAQETASEALRAQEPHDAATQIYDRVVRELTKTIGVLVSDKINTLTLATESTRGKPKHLRPDRHLRAGVPDEFSSVMISERDADGWPYTFSKPAKWVDAETTMAQLLRGELVFCLRRFSGWSAVFQEDAAVCWSESLFRYVPATDRDAYVIFEEQNFALEADLRVLPAVLADQISSLSSWPRERFNNGHICITFSQTTLPGAEQLLHLQHTTAATMDWTEWSKESYRNQKSPLLEPTITGRMIVDSQHPVHVRAVWNSKPELPSRAFYSLDEGFRGVSWIVARETDLWYSTHEIIIDQTYTYDQLGILTTLLDGSNTIDQMMAYMRHRADEIYDGDSLFFDAQGVYHDPSLED